jgi:cytochrome b pre-mRNA-processing protein 3
MNFLTKLLGLEADPRERLRPLWHRVVECAREPGWYAECGVADTVDGRFDMITAVLSAALVRLEASDATRADSALLTEFFVDDMDSQLREFGVNDVVVGKRVGKLMSVLGGRLGAYRPALLSGDNEKLDAAIERNVSFTDDGSPSAVRAKLVALAEQLAGLSDDELIAAEQPLGAFE